MKTKLLSIAAALIAGVAVAETQYLYWMIDLGDQSEYAFSYATVSAGGDLLLNQTTGGKEAGEYIGNVNITAQTPTAIGTKTALYYAYDVSSYLGSTFVFELFDTEDQRIGYHAISGASLENYIGGSMSTLSSPYTVTSVVPEPTGGLLVLIGLAGLALRRRKAV